jgi:anti-sigma regulatory factor (Ser/Thr protein kinase)
MARLGVNPARIIPAWQSFVDEQAAHGRPFRGIGEPIWPERTPDELVECERHEALLNVAFADSPPWWLVCPYDVSALDPVVVAEAERNHPGVFEGDVGRPSPRFRGLERITQPFDAPLPAAPAKAERTEFDGASIRGVRAWIVDLGRAYGLEEERLADLAVAVDELMTNSVLYGGGHGTVAAWSAGASFVAEVRDAGWIRDPLIGRRRPTEDQWKGFGVWIVTQVCDLVQIRSSEEGSVVRIHLAT